MNTDHTNETKIEVGRKKKPKPLKGTIVPPAPRQVKPRKVKGRKCGRCSACCTLLEVANLGKPADAKCRYMRGGRRGRHGCAIYDERPDICAAYECLWIQGALRHKDKPSRLGMVFDTLVRQEPDTPAVCARNIHPGAPLSKEARLVMQEFAKSLIVVHVDSASEARTIMGPQEMVHKFTARAEARLREEPDLGGAFVAVDPSEVEGENDAGE